MAIEVKTKDCTALSDAEKAEMADICADGPSGYNIGLISKQCEEWVLISQARHGNRLVGFSFCTLERIGGTPSVLWGMASVKRNSRRDTVLRALCADQYARAVLAFPDEDVLVGTRLVSADGFQALKGLEDICPRPGHKPTGEERAWCRRLAKRFGGEKRVNERSFVLTGTGEPEPAFDFEALRPESVGEDKAAFFEACESANGDTLICFGWAMADDIANKFGPK